MKVLFLDFDGVLNSEASFRWEKRKKTIHIANTLSPIACSNLQHILEQDRDVKIVISSTWRKIHTMVELQNILNSYGVEAARIIGKTPLTFSGDRGREIRQWLEDNPNVTKYVIIDDDTDAGNALNMYDEKTDTFVPDTKGIFIDTTWEDGLLIVQAVQAAKFFRGEK